MIEMSDRLTPLDVSFLYLETPTTAMHVGGVDSGGARSMKGAKTEISARLGRQKETIDGIAEGVDENGAAGGDRVGR